MIAPRAQMLTTDLPGRIAPIRVAEVRARVAGIVQKRHFTEGAVVKEGDLLFTVEPAPLQAALERNRGALARAQAQSSRPNPGAPLRTTGEGGGRQSPSTTTRLPHCKPRAPTRCLPSRRAHRAARPATPRCALPLVDA